MRTWPRGASVESKSTMPKSCLTADALSSPAVFHVQYTEVKSAALAVVSNELTLIVAADYHTVRFVELPLADGMACVNGLDSTLGVQYRKKTGHQICEGVIMAIERVELVFKDDSQGAAFAESIRNRLVSKSQDELSPDLPQVPRRMSHASIDMSRSRETSTESTSESDRNNRSIESPLDSDTQLLETTPQTRQAQPDERELPHLPPLIPLRQATKTHEHLTGLVDEEDPIDLEELAQQAVSHSSIKTRPLTKSPEQPKLHLPTIRITQTKNMPPGDATTVSTSQTGKHSEELEKDSQRRLKRPGGKDAGNTSTSQVDWDEDLRAEEIESEAPAAKRPKTTSQQTKKSQAATKSKAGKASNTKKTTGNPMPQASDKNRTKPVSGKTVASTRARRSAAAKPTTYEEDSESDHDKDREQDGLVQVQNSNPTPSEKATSKSEKKQVSDSQGQDKSRQSSSDDLDELRVLDEPRSSDIAPVHPLGKEDHEPDQTAHDSHPLDNFQKAQAPDRNDTSFGSKMLQMLGKELQPVAAPSARNSFGNAKSFVQTVNDTRSSSPLKPPTKDARNSLSEADTHMKSAPVAVRETSESTEGLVTAHTNVHPFEDPPEVGHSNEPTIQAEDVDTVHETGDIEHVLQAPATNVDDGVIVVKKITYQKTVTTTINTSDGDDKGDRHIGTEDQKALPSIITAKPAGTGKKWLSRSSLPSCTLEEVPDTSESRRSMAPPKRPSRAQRQSDTAPAKSTIIEGDQSSILTDERVQKKTSIVSFDAQGPRNQGIPSPIKPPNSAEKPVDAPPETGRHAASKRPSFAEPPNLSLTKSTSPQAELTSDNVAAEVSEINEDDEEGILVLEDSAFEPTAREEVTSNALGRNAKQAKASNKDSSKSNNWGRNASQGSKVDENGSPRLHQIQNSRTSILTEQTTSELSESSPVASEDRENSEYTNESGSSPAHRATESLPNITPLQPKVMMRKPRGSLGLTSLTSQTFSKAAPVINTAIFKQSAKSVLYKPPVVVENTVKKAIEKAKPRKANAKDDQEKDKGGGRLEIPISQQPAVSSSSTMLPRLETDTGVVRLGPKTPAERAKEDPKTSPTPASFQTEFKNMLMPPPPLPFPKLKNPDVVVAQTEQGKRRRRPTTEDADLTLVDEEDFAEPRPARPAARSRQRPSPDSSSDSDSSRLRSTPPLGTANMDREICRVATRPTQENLHATLGSLINVSSWQLLSPLALAVVNGVIEGRY